ncbi:hypothetical protein ACFQW6_02815 [Nocardioides sp. GCM10028917]|uniref:hypothetical protein n=1 Tax=Nocardioides sp. GCM10028917 TaxID=3273408 RepID=UPI003613410B
MQLIVLWRTLVRRWYLALVVLALVVASTYLVVHQVGPTYKAEGSALVFPPTSSRLVGGATKVQGNPYLQLAGVSQARDIVIRTLKSKSIHDEWASEFPGYDYEVTPDFTNSAPIILFTVEGSSSTGSAAALHGLMEHVPVVLLELQDGLGLTQYDMVTAKDLTRDEVPEVIRKTQIRAGILAAAVTLTLGLLLLALLESLLAARTRTRTDPITMLTQVEPHEADAPTPPDDRGDTQPAEPPDTRLVVSRLSKGRKKPSLGHVEPEGADHARGEKLTSVPVPTGRMSGRQG